MSVRAKRAPRQVGNVVPLRPEPESTEDIVRNVEERRLTPENQILGMLEGLNAGLEVRHRERAQQCVPIGVAMTRATLDDWIEIGRRMLERGRR